jgi:hypothetical protein
MSPCLIAWPFGTLAPPNYVAPSPFRPSPIRVVFSATFGFDHANPEICDTYGAFELDH